MTWTNNTQGRFINRKFQKVFNDGYEFLQTLTAKKIKEKEKKEENFENWVQRNEVSDLHKLRYCHLETTSHQMPTKMRDQAEQFAAQQKRKYISSCCFNRNTKLTTLEGKLHPINRTPVIQQDKHTT